MAPDSDDPDDAAALRERVRELEQTVSDQQNTIEKMLPSRRQAIAGGALLGGGLLGGYGGSQRASAQTSGQVGTSDEPVDIYTNEINTDALDVDTLNSADIATASSGEVPKSQGDGTLAFGSVGGGRWGEESNSPYSSSSSASINPSSLESFDLLSIQYAVENAGGGEDINLTLNGDTGSNYDYWDTSGNKTNGNSAIDRVTQVDGSNNAYGEFLVGQVGAPDAVGVRNISAATTAVAEVGYNESISAPVSQFTLKTGGGNSADWTISIYGLTF